jgi:hypothetical protein
MGDKQDTNQQSHPSWGSANCRVLATCIPGKTLATEKWTLDAEPQPMLGSSPLGH